MSNLALITEQIKSEIVVDTSGKGKCSIRGTARLMDVSAEAIRKLLKTSVNQNEGKISKELTLYGFWGVNLDSWMHQGIPDLAIAVIAKYYGYRAGRYCTQQARLVDAVFGAMGVRAWMQKVSGWKQEDHKNEQALTLNPVAEIKCASDVIDLIVGGTGIDPMLIAGIKANFVIKNYPQLASIAEDTKTLLSIPVNENLVTASKLSEMYAQRTGNPKMSAQAFNKLLEQRGMQVRNPDRNPSWLPTEEGKMYGKLVLDTAKHNNKTVQTLRWKPSVIDVI